MTFIIVTILISTIILITTTILITIITVLITSITILVTTDIIAVSNICCQILLSTSLVSLMSSLRTTLQL